jgi:hypothetical protein
VCMCVCVCVRERERERGKREREREKERERERERARARARENTQLHVHAHNTIINTHTSFYIPSGARARPVVHVRMRRRVCGDASPNTSQNHSICRQSFSERFGIRGVALEALDVSHSRH